MPSACFNPAFLVANNRFYVNFKRKAQNFIVSCGSLGRGSLGAFALARKGLLCYHKAKRGEDIWLKRQKKKKKKSFQKTKNKNNGYDINP